MAVKNVCVRLALLPLNHKTIFALEKIETFTL
jgi:hypothetical protein